MKLTIGFCTLVMALSIGAIVQPVTYSYQTVAAQAKPKLIKVRTLSPTSNVDAKTLVAKAHVSINR